VRQLHEKKTVFLLLIPLLAQAQLTPDEFASGFNIELEGDYSVYHLLLPEDVYQTVAFGNLTDLRVFNNAGEVVPHAFRSLGTVINEESVARTLPIFPITSVTRTGTTGNSLNITIADDGTLIRIRNSEPASPDPQERTIGYILDTSGVDDPIQELQFSIDNNNEDYLQAFRLEQSDDLNRWQILVPKSTLVDMAYGDFALQKDRVLLPSNHQKYLRLVFENPAENILIAEVIAHSTLTEAQSQETWLTVSGIRTEDQQSTITFDRGGFFSTNRMDVVLPDDNTLLETIIYSRTSEDANWQQYYQGVVYRLNVEGNEVQSDPFLVRPTQNRYWKMEVLTEGGIGQRIPQLRFAWTPSELYFLARGEGPFTMAFGNIALDEVDEPIGILINALDEDQQSVFVGSANLGDRLNLRGAAALEVPVQFPWRQLLLWTVLGMGIFAAGFMAYRLFKQMQVAD